jgi:hypothetical protein
MSPMTRKAKLKIGDKREIDRAFHDGQRRSEIDGAASNE